MSTRYRMIFGTAAVLAVLAVGGIAAGQQGGNSADHRQNPTTTTVSAVNDPTTTLAPAAEPVEDQGVGPSSESQHARCDIALNNGAPIAQWNKSQAPAFADCNPPLLGTPRPQTGNAADQGQGAGSDNPGQGHGQGQGAGPDNSHAQGHGKP